MTPLPSLDGELYFDWNATTPIHPDVAAAMREAERSGWANPSSVHAAGRRARALIETARERLAALVDVHPRDVLFTASGTEANNLALSAATALVTSRIEHPSVTRVAERLAAQGVPVRWLPVPVSGRIDPDDVAAALAEVPRGALVAVMAANHETGVVQPIGALAEVVRRAGARLHVDAVQALGKLDAARFRDADSLTVSAHKLRGPKGVAALAFRAGWTPSPVLVGGAQERGLRPGTLDAVAIAGFDAALRRVSDGPARYARLAALRDAFERRLEGHAQPNGAGVERLPHVSNLSFTGWRGDELVAALDLAGVRVSSGSACSAGSVEPSPVVGAMLGIERASSAVRVSVAEDATSQQFEQAASVWFQVLGRHSFERLGCT